MSRSYLEEWNDGYEAATVGVVRFDGSVEIQVSHGHFVDSHSSGYLEGWLDGTFDRLFERVKK